MSDHQKYRVLANQGHIAARKRQFDAAVTLLCESAELASSKTLANISLAYAAIHRGDDQTAHTLSLEALNADRTNLNAAAISVLSDISNKDTGEILASLSQQVRDSEPVLEAAIIREMRRNRLDNARQIARNGLCLNPSSATLRQEFARIIIAGLQNKYGRSQPTRLSGDERDSLKAAVKYLDEARDDVHLERTDQDLADLLQLRGEAKWYLGDSASALNDLSSSASIGRSLDLHVLPYLYRLCQLNKRDEAIGFIQSTFATPWPMPIAVMSASLLASRNHEKDAELAIDSLKESLSAYPHPTYIDTFIGLMSMADTVEHVSPKSAESLCLLIEECKPRLTSYGLKIVSARASQLSGDRDTAMLLIDEATTEATAECDLREHRLCAEVLDGLGRHEEATALLARFVDFHSMSSGVDQFLTISFDTKQHWMALESLRKLRQNHLATDKMYVAEATLLADYFALDELESLILSAERENISEETLKQLRLRKSLLAALTGEQERIEKDVSRLPNVADVKHEDLEYFSIVMREGPGRIHAINQLYHLVRLDRTAPEPAKRFAFAMMIEQDGEDPVGVPECISIGTAARLRDTNGTEEWYVIEEGDGADTAHREFSPDHPSVASLIGHHVGDVVLAKGPFDGDSREIVEIIDKRVYLLRSILRTFPDIHPDSNTFQAVPVKQRPDGDLDLRILGVQLQQFQDAQDESVSTYRESSVPLEWLAEASNRSLSHVWEFVALRSDLKFRVIQGRPEEVSQGAESARRWHTLVLDPTALLTLLHTQAYKSLDFRRMNWRVVVPLASVQVVWSLIADSPYSESGTGRVGANAGRPVFSFGSVEEWAIRTWRYGRFLKWVKTQCDVIDSLSYAKVPPSRREVLKLLSLGSATAIAYSESEGAALWTDDLFIAHVGRNHGVKNRTYTLAVLESLEADRHLPQGDLESLRCELISIGYSLFPLRESTFLSACEKSKWDAKAMPLNGICRWFSDRELLSEFVLGTLLSCIRSLHAHCKLAHSEDAILSELLRNVSLRQNDGASLLRSLSKGVRQFFPIDIPLQNRVVIAVRTWLGVSSMSK